MVYDVWSGNLQRHRARLNNKAAVMSDEIWSISLTHEGLGVCALGMDMARRDYSVQWPLKAQFGVRTVDSAAVLRLVAHALSELLKDHEPPLAIAVVSPNAETACFVDDKDVPVSPVFLEELLTIPKSAIPERFSELNETSQAFRNSVIRRIQQMQPTFGMNGAFGVWSLGMLVMHGMTGHAMSACIPRGMVDNIGEYDEESKALIYQAMGINVQNTGERIRPGHVAARISPMLVSRLASNDLPELEKLAGIPVFDMGCWDGAFAYAVAANPLSCAVYAGWDMRALWTAGVSALSAYEIQIISRDETRETDETPQEKTVDEWTRLFQERIEVEKSPGPGKNLQTYGWMLPPMDSAIIKNSLEKLINAESGRIPMKTMSCVPLGSCGLHLHYCKTGWRMMGLTAAHGTIHLARALFEGMIYEVRTWLEIANPEGTNPLKVCIGRPWPAECAQWAADILREKVFYLEESVELLSAFGASLSLLRSLNVDNLPSPHLRAEVIEPDERSVCYQPHYEIHRYLRENG